MARWLLTEPHYLKVPGNEWEYQEDAANGERLRTRYPVPKFLDPKDTRAWNSPDGIVVCHAGKGEPKDVVFNEPPTPGMLPLDAEAEAITAEWQKRWTNPIEDLSPTIADTQSILAQDRTTPIRAPRRV